MPRPAKYTHVAALLEERIRAGAYDEAGHLPAEHELAASLGVHRLTLRKAVDVLARDSLVVRRPGCGTLIRRKAASSAPPLLLFVGETRSHFYEGFYQALCGEAQDRNLAVLAWRPEAPKGESRARFEDLIRQHRRLICIESAWPLVRDLVPDGVHVTRVSGFHSVESLTANDRPGYVVSTDQYRAVKLAVEHLVHLGHRRIGLLEIGWKGHEDPRLGRPNPQRPTIMGYRAALQEHGLAREWLLMIPDVLPVADWQAHEAESIRRHFELWPELPTAFVCAYDFRAAPLINVLRERGLRVPEDVSVAGIGNTPWAQWVTPPLTTVCLGEAEMARLALVLNSEPEPARARVVRIDPELVVRNSTVPPAGRKHRKEKPS